ncbi:MAG: lipopolysaccharide/colanic/teichoic acid biosynthesis glycosyltransferase [Planctomycetota bacterium]|jgi:lipopolysaccharide/colanic/teichoic acid biosynthesis glycosyltransferase
MRTHGQMSLIAIARDGQGPSELLRAADQIKESLRGSDVIGNLGQGRLGILLPETSESNAHSLVDSILAGFAQMDIHCVLEVSGIPLRGAQATRSHARRESDSEEPDGLMDMAAGEVAKAPQPAIQSSLAPDSVTASSAKAQGVATVECAVDASARDPEMPDAVLRGQAPAVGLPAIHEQTDPVPAQGLNELFRLRIAPLQRGLDIVASSTALVVMLPLFALVAIAIKLTSEGPVIYRQKRAGLGGRPFWFYKFRSRHVDADARKEEPQREDQKDGSIFKIKHDSRVTSIGRVIVRYSFDELPQLLNVLRGDMAFVGPRPATVYAIEAYEPWQRERLNIAGGLMCIWQVSCRSAIDFYKWTRMDMQYFRKRSSAFDAGLIPKTFGAAFPGKGKY